MNPRTALAALCLTGAATAAEAADPHVARNLAATCTACHGTGGKSVGGMRNLAGEAKADLLHSLRSFRSGEKPATVMHQISKGYTDEQLQLIAAYFAAQRKE
jgi:cytochrome c553